MSRRTWLFIGAGFGFAVPVLLNVLQRFGPWQVRPSAYFLFRPGLIVLMPVGELLERTFSMLFLGLLIFAVNAAVFGAVAYGLRQGFLVLIAVLLAINYVSLPPSDAKLERKFTAEKLNFERLIQKASQTPSVVRIGKVEIEDIGGRKYREGEKQGLLSPESWGEYREILEKTGMREGLYRSPQTGQIEFLTHTIFGKVSPIGTLYGYVYCPAESNALGTGLLPCSRQKDEYDIIDYRYKRIAPEWFIVEIFQTHSVSN
jgi:hypothetical protein